MQNDLRISKIKDFEAWVVRKGPHRIGSIKRDNGELYYVATPVTGPRRVKISTEQISEIARRMEVLDG